MQKYTIKEALELEEYIDPDGHCIYVYRDGDVIFYIGRSIDPLNRFLEHMGMGDRPGFPSLIGQLIKDNMPDSLAWTLEVYTLAECAGTVQRYMPHSIERYVSRLERRDNYNLLADDAEQALIDHFKPCLNRMKMRYSNPLPAKYDKHPIANAGVKLSDESATSSVSSPTLPN